MKGKLVAAFCAVGAVYTITGGMALGERLWLTAVWIGVGAVAWQREDD